MAGSITESLNRVAENPTQAVLFGLVNSVIILLASGPGSVVVIAGGIGDPTALTTLDGTEFLLVLIGGTITATFGPVYVTAFYRRVGPGPADGAPDAEKDRSSGRTSTPRRG